MNIDHARIEAILFDFVGVLLFPRSEYLADQTVDTIDKMVGQVTDDHEFRMTVQANFQIDDDRFKNIIACISDKYEAFQPLWHLLPELRQHYKLAIINNGTWLTFPFFEAKLKITQQFDFFISSAVEGVRKPDERIFWRACQRLGVAPRNCLFMDDSLANIQGAQQVGMQTIHWKNREDGFQQFIGVFENKL